MMLFALCLVAFSLIGWTYLTFFRDQFWRPLMAMNTLLPLEWPSVDIIVPVCDEGINLPQSLPSLLAQNYPGTWRILLIDDHSSDGTSVVAESLARQQNKEGRLKVMRAPDLNQMWKSGKVAAMDAGVNESSADYILFTDANIQYSTDSLRQLVGRARSLKLDLVSLMVLLRCESFAEKLLIPAFVFFFTLLYPFRASNDPERLIAAAAGGVMLVRRQALDNIGGLYAIRSSLIDDCALASAMKRSGGDLSTAGRTELTLTHTVKSLRAYSGIKDVWRMIARSAFTQLRRSVGLLMATVILMSLLFLAPVILSFTGEFWIDLFAMMAWTLMIAIYIPMIRFYRLPWIWALTLPAASIIFIGATIDSAYLYWQGKGELWKGRAQA